MKKFALVLVAACLATAAFADNTTSSTVNIDPHRFEAAIQAFEETDRLAEPSGNAFLFYGSSSIFYWHDMLAEDLAPLEVLPRGFGGSTIIGALHYARRVVIPSNPKAVVLYEGDNDIAKYGMPVDEFVGLFRQFVTLIHQELPDTRIYFLSIKPSPSRWQAWPIMREANRRVEAICDNDDLLQYIDVASPMLDADGLPIEGIFVQDKLHMNRDGYLIWKNVVRASLID